MDTGMVILILAAIFLLAGLVTAILGYKTWPIYTILLVILNLFAVTTFIYMAARTLKVRHEWSQTVKQWEETYARLDAEFLALRDGDRAAEDLDARYSIADIRTQLNTLLNSRGPAWGIMGRDFKPKSDDQPRPPLVASLKADGAKLTGTVTFKTEAAPIGLAEKKTVYLFIDTSLNDKPKLTGEMYLGFYQITKLDGKTVTVERVLPIMPAIDKVVEVVDKPVIMFEVFPNDDYQTLAVRAQGQTRYGAIRSPEYVRELLAAADPADRDDYLRHGSPLSAADAEALLKEEETAANATDVEKNAINGVRQSRVWYRLKLKKDYEIDQAAGKAKPAPPAAVEPGADGAEAEPAEAATPQFLAENSTIMVDHHTAQKMIADGWAVYDDQGGKEFRYYYRPLRDYPANDLRHREMIVGVERSISEVERLIAINTETQQSTQQTIDQLAAHLEKLKADGDELGKETAGWKGYDSAILKQIAGLRTQHSQVLAAISARGKELVQLQLEAQRLVNSRILAQERAAAP